ncbi:MAG: NAD(P)-dependent oxidoreductase, partial [Pseudomonadota bacterium]
MKVGLIGCGAMGGAMAARLAETGDPPICHDAAHAALEAAAACGGEPAASAAAVAAVADVLILSLPHGAAVRAAMAEAGPALRPGAVVLDATTSDPATSREMAAAADAAGHAFVDAPVSGGPSGARAGTMTMLLGGDADAIARARPVVDRLTAKTVHVGGSGAGHAAKILNNMLCAANLVLVSEAAHMAEAAGLDPAAVLEGVNAGSGRSGVSEVNFPRWALSGAYDSGFTMGLMRKDVALAVAFAEEAGVPL